MNTVNGVNKLWGIIPATPNVSIRSKTNFYDKNSFLGKKIKKKIPKIRKEIFCIEHFTQQLFL